MGFQKHRTDKVNLQMQKSLSVILSVSTNWKSKASKRDSNCYCFFLILLKCKMNLFTLFRLQKILTGTDKLHISYTFVQKKKMIYKGLNGLNSLLWINAPGY